MSKILRAKIMITRKTMSQQEEIKVAEDLKVKVAEVPTVEITKMEVAVVVVAVVVVVAKTESFIT